MSLGNDYFVYDGIDSRSFDAMVFDRNTSSSPTKEYSTVAIPGRSGDFILSGHRFTNVPHEYDVIIRNHFDENFESLKGLLLSRDGYCRLEDSIHPNEFYKAYYSETIEPKVSKNRKLGKFTLRFSRKPQRYLLSGEQETILRQNNSTQTSVITNPTQFPCYPLIMVKDTNMSSGFEFSVNGTKIKLLAYDSTTRNYDNPDYLNSYWLYIDFETTQAYVIVGSKKYFYNAAVQYVLPSDVRNAFKLQPGNNYMTYTSVTNAYNIKVIPRWYVL